MNNIIVDIDRSIEEAKEWATNILTNDDTVTTTAVIRGGEKTVQTSCDFPDDGRDHSAAKHEFAFWVRCHAVAEQASEVILITEAWGASPEWNGRPSLCPQRTEVLFVTVENSRHVATSVWELRRDAKQRFRGLGSEIGRNIRQRGPSGRDGILSGLLPGKKFMEDPELRVFARRYVSDPVFRQQVRPGAR